MADLQKQFDEAARAVNELKVRPSNEELLQLYGLFKQATEGDCNTPKPGVFDLKAKAKHEAWSSNKGMGQNEAKQKYIETSEKLVAKYASK